MAKTLCPCRFPIPLTRNNGTQIGAAKLVEIQQALSRQFGGFTILGERDGCWSGLFERSIWFEVSVAESEIPALQEVIKIIGRNLGQKAMYFERGLPSVEILDTQGA